MIPLSVFTRFSSQGASSRYRFFMYIRTLMANDFNVDVHQFFYSNYLEELYGGKNVSRRKIILCFLKRMVDLLVCYDNLYIEYELFPKFPYWVERLFLAKKRYILGFDDDVWSNYQKSKMLKTKYDRLVEKASGVIVANEFLFDKVGQLNPNVIKIPTMVDRDDYVGEYEKYDRFSVVWIGTPVTYKYILSHAGIFKKLANMIDYDLLIVAKKHLESQRIENVNMKFFDWSPSTEVEIIKRSHVGIMPLDDDGFAHGKSAFKLIQYCAAGLPVVARDLGENRMVVQENINGFLIGKPDEFISALGALYKDETLRHRMEKASKVQSEKFYLQRYSPKIVNFMRQCLDVNSLVKQNNN